VMIFVATIVAAFITSGGRSAWFVGVLLLFVYLVFAITLYLWPPPGTKSASFDYARKWHSADIPLAITEVIRFGGC
jgi:hypothetical protein